MRALIFVLCILASSNVAAQELARPQCTVDNAFGLPFGERVAQRDVRRALVRHPGFQDLLINDGDIARPMHRVTALARYESPHDAEMAQHLLITALFDSEEFVAEFSNGDIDDESFESGIVYNSGDVDLNQGVTLAIVREHATLLVTCTNLGLRAQALTAR